jgi:hypothetical protein
VPEEFIIPELGRTLKEKKQEKTRNDTTPLKGKPFWIWDKKEHKKLYNELEGQCCFNHIAGLPVKNGRARPIYPFQKQIYDLTMGKVKEARMSDEELEKIHGKDYIRRLGVWIEKATGLGVSEFYLRLMGWLCCYDDYYKGSDFCIVTGPNIKLASDLIDRFKDIFYENLKFRFDDSKFEATVNDVHLEAFPSDNLAALRGRPDVKFILLDEADFFSIGSQKQVRAIAERYIGKSNSIVVMVSTPNADVPDGLYTEMKLEFDEARKRGTLQSILYDPLELPYTVGLGTMFSEAEMAQAKLSPSFETEYNLQRGFGLGNLFMPETVKKIIELGEKLGEDKINVNDTYVAAPNTFELVLDLNSMYAKSDIKYDKPLFVPTIGSTRVMGIDGAFGSSKFAICVVELVQFEGEPVVKVLYSDEFERIDYDNALTRCESLIKFYGIKRVYIDSANPEVVGGIRKIYGEQHDWTLDRRLPSRWSGFPVSFNKEGRPLLAKLQRMGEMGNLAVSPYFKNLLVYLRIAQHQSYNLEKVGKTQLDELDALRLACKHFVFS